MKHTRRFVLLSVLALLLIFPTTAFLCGVERWKVKTCKDTTVNRLFVGNDTSNSLRTPQHTDIETLIGLPRPAGTPGNTRVATAERKIWVIEAILTDYKQELGAHGDTDYHLALEDDDGNTMIAEIPKQSCVTGTTPQPLRDMIHQARVDFDAHFTVTGSFKHTHTRVRITGPAMFDFLHGQKGVADNGIEIHPILKIEFIN
ncbi:MAG TPA: hypothetical protein VJ875_06365 [Pyrinomonadaceae bacterium]|nr:hypothetical protein [Pyrinomonadaceae bacterium]